MLRLRNYRYSTQHDITHKTSSYSNLKPTRLQAKCLAQARCLASCLLGCVLYYINNNHSLRKPTRLSVYPMSYVCIVSTIDARSTKPDVWALCLYHLIRSMKNVFK